MNTSNTELKKIYKEYADAFSKASENSRAEYIAHLAPGSTLPPTGKLYGEDARNEFNAKCTDLAHKASKIIDGELTKLNAELTKEPTPEAVNVCTLLSLRKSTDATEYMRLMEKYSDNVQTCDTIRKIAKDNGILSIPASPIRERAENLEYFKNHLYFKMTSKDAEDGNTSPVSIKLFNAQIDKLIPPDPEDGEE